MKINIQLDGVQRLLKKNMVAVAKGIVQAVEENLSEPYPPSSESGEFPKRRTGRLQRSIRYRVELPTRTIRFESKAPYSGKLAEGGREFFMRTIREKKDQILKAAATGVWEE